MFLYLHSAHEEIRISIEPVSTARRPRRCAFLRGCSGVLSRGLSALLEECARKPGRHTKTAARANRVPATVVWSMGGYGAFCQIQWDGGVVAVVRGVEGEKLHGLA